MSFSWPPFRTSLSRNFRLLKGPILHIDLSSDDVSDHDDGGVRPLSTGDEENLGNGSNQAAGSIVVPSGRWMCQWPSLSFQVR
jgi:hypothetical protein